MNYAYYFNPIIQMFKFPNMFRRNILQSSHSMLVNLWTLMRKSFQTVYNVLLFDEQEINLINVSEIYGNNGSKRVNKRYNDIWRKLLYQWSDTQSSPDSESP